MSRLSMCLLILCFSFSLYSQRDTLPKPWEILKGKTEKPAFDPSNPYLVNDSLIQKDTANPLLDLDIHPPESLLHKTGYDIPHQTITQVGKFQKIIDNSYDNNLPLATIQLDSIIELFTELENEEYQIGYFEKAWCYYLKKDYFNCIQSVNEVINNPFQIHVYNTDSDQFLALGGGKFSHQYYYLRAICKQNMLDYRGAIIDYDVVIKTLNDCSSCYINKGISKYNIEDYLGAIQDENKAVQLGANEPIAYYFMGLGRIHLNQKNIACLDFSKAGELGYHQAYDMIKKYCQ